MFYGVGVPNHITIDHVISFNGVHWNLVAFLGGFLLAWMLLATSKK